MSPQTRKRRFERIQSGRAVVGGRGPCGLRSLGPVSDAVSSKSLGKSVYVLATRCRQNVYNLANRSSDRNPEGVELESKAQ